MSLMTSRYPAPALQSMVPSPPRLDDSATTLAEVLGAAGYETVSVATNPYNDDLFNLMQGFDTQELRLSAPAKWVVDRTIEFLDRRESEGGRAPVFAFLHLMDVHVPLVPPPPYDTLFPTRDGRPHRRAHANLLSRPLAAKPGSEAVRTYFDHVVALYDGALRFADAEIGRLIDHLRSSGRWDDTLFVVTSDHGEELWDHEELGRELGLSAYHNPKVYGVGHGHTLLPELVEVPLVIGGGRVPVGRVPTQIRLLDLAPSLLELAGVDGAGLAGLGAPVVGLWNAGQLSELPALSETHTRRAEQVSLREGGLQFYRIGEDEILLELPGGRVADPPADLMQKARRSLDRFVPTVQRAPSVPSDLTIEYMRRLQALGYVRE